MACRDAVLLAQTYGCQCVEFEGDSVVIRSFSHVRRSENKAADLLAIGVLQDDSFVYNLIAQSSFV